MLQSLCVTKQYLARTCSSLNIVKNGKTGQRKQSYLRKDCRRQFIRDYTYLGCVGAVNALIVPLTMNG
jgi:transposase-like protein